MTPSTLRYQLPKKAIKTDCPDCGPKHRRTLSRYVDTRTDEPLSEIYGKCDRESNCGYHLSPYHKGPSGLSYADWVYRQGKENRMPLANATGLNVITPKPQTVAIDRTPTPSIHSLPDSVFTQSIGHYERNVFAHFLQDHFGAGVATDLLKQFQVGTSSYWPGACVFWLRDEQHRTRGGQVVLFDKDGHTVKRPLSDGSIKRCTGWVHYALATRYDKKDEPRPEWLTTYMDKADKFPIPFGLHQLSTTDATKAVAIVESPKTAIVCTSYFPQFVWMAIGGLTYLSVERLAPLQTRKLVLFPDTSTGGKAFNLWNTRAEQLREQGFSVTVSDYLEQRATDEEKAGGLDLADYLLTKWKGYPPDWDIE